ncbi:MAG: hypothetical protein M5U01_37750 [Ardenticatenaceae bacterium]|nr:hypothetical protein [Ardenticatenaceae bacterium]HBY96741.1 hypothetical protein [Chloroflexota bacterium]
MEDIPDDTLDERIRRLVDVLNQVPGVVTRGSCGGHPDPQPGQWPMGTCYVSFRIDPDERGWYALEFLTWAVGQYQRAGGPWGLRVWSAGLSPVTAGRCLFFALIGTHGVNPDDLAESIGEWLETVFWPYYGSLKPPAA